MSEADILATTYDDTCTVYRPFKDTLNTGETVFNNGLNGKIEYENIPCALSSASGGKLSQSESTAKAPCDYTLFVCPEIDILPNDTVMVTQQGKEIELAAGLADKFVSHNEVPLKLSNEVV